MQRLQRWLGAMLLTYVGIALTPSIVRADERTEARKEFRAGMQLVGEGKYDDAIAHLERAYDILPHPNVLYNIALAHYYAGRGEAALYYFERYKEGAPDTDAVEVDSIIARLRQANPEPRVAEGPSETQSRESRSEAPANTTTTQQGQSSTQAQPLANTAPAVPLKTEQAARQNVYDEQVVSASRFSQSPLDAPNATAIITAQDIRLTGITNLNELLRRVAGVEVNSVTPNHAEISIRGLNRRTSNKVLFLIDGRPLRQDFLGSSWLDFLPISIEDVERIEVIRGPASALYGADAFSGIINVITRAPGEGSSFVMGGVGNKEQGRGVASFTGREGKLSYHVGSGYETADNAVRITGKNRVDVASLTDSPNISTRQVWANSELRYALAPKSLATMGGSIVYGDHVVQGLSRLGQVTVHDASVSQVYGSITTPVGIRLGTFWNRFAGSAGSSQITPGAIDLVSTGTTQDIIDIDLSLSRSFHWGVPQNLTIGGGYRYKSIRNWTWLDGDHTQHHLAAYIQDVLQVAKPLRVQFGARLDRHPLLSSLQFSPRGSIIYRLAENQSLRATVGRAFRGPSFLESYLQVPNGSPVRGATAWGVGNGKLDPESITSFELGYQNQASDVLSFELNGYYNLVKNAILFTDLDTFTLSDFASDDDRLAKFASDVNAFPISALSFTNERATFRQIGGEAGLRLYPVKGLDLYTNYAIHDTSPVDNKQVDPVRAKEQQTSRHKINGGVQYRARFGLDTSIDMSWSSRQIWVEQVTDLERGVRFEAFAQKDFFLLHARLGYRLLQDRLELGLVGTNLTFQRQRQHPFGQPVDTRILATTKLRF